MRRCKPHEDSEPRSNMRSKRLCHAALSDNQPLLCKFAPVIAATVSAMLLFKADECSGAAAAASCNAEGGFSDIEFQAWDADSRRYVARISGCVAEDQFLRDNRSDVKIVRLIATAGQRIPMLRNGSFSSEMEEIEINYCDLEAVECGALDDLPRLRIVSFADEKTSSAKTITLKQSENCSATENSTHRVEADSTTEEEKSGPEEEEAAIKIQAVFRGHQTRKTMKQADKPEPEPTREELEAEFRADDRELCHAATKIQASFRGHMSRKQADGKEETSGSGEQAKKTEEEEVLDIDLTDPELNKAATKIQASFRGHKVRKEDGDH